MSYNGSGTFNINTAGQPVVTGTVITSTAFNLLTADLASGLTTALTKDGQTTPTANIPMGTFKITGLGAGTALTDAAQFGQLQTGATQIATVTGTDTLAGTLTPTPTAYATGNLYSFAAANTNTGAATININSLGAKSITKLGTTALAAGDLVSGRIYLIEYDGTRFQLINPSASSVTSFSAGTTGFTPFTATTGAVTLAGTLATTNGGTGLTSFTSGGVVYASSSSALATGSALVFDGTNLGIGTSSPAFKLVVSNGGASGIEFGPAFSGTANLIQSYNRSGGVYVNTVYDANEHIFNTLGTQRMRLDSSGNLLVGATSGSGRLFVSLASSTVPIIVASNQFAGSSGLNTFYSSLGNGTNSVANTNCYHLQAVSQGSAIYYLYGNGTTSFTSDQRLKKNIETTRNGYAQDLCKLRVVKYQWNTEPDDGPKELGLIAQEVEQVFPGLVQDAADEIQGIKPKVLKASVLPLMLLKAIQEQQAIIESLKARLDAANL